MRPLRRWLSSQGVSLVAVGCVTGRSLGKDAIFYTSIFCPASKWASPPLFLRVAFLALGPLDFPLLPQIINPLTHHHMGFDLDDICVRVDVLTDLMQAAHRGRMHVYE